MGKLVSWFQKRKRLRLLRSFFDATGTKHAKKNKPKKSVKYAKPLIQNYGAKVAVSDAAKETRLRQEVIKEIIRTQLINGKVSSDKINIAIMKILVRNYKARIKRVGKENTIMEFANELGVEPYKIQKILESLL